MVETFGIDTPANWAKISPFGDKHPARFVAIGPNSEWDSCVVVDSPAVGSQIISVGSPLICPIDREITIRPHRTFGNVSGEGQAGRLELLVYEQMPMVWPARRAPRIYPYDTSQTLTSANEFSIFLNTEYRPDGTVRRRPGGNLVVAGARAVTIYISNQSLTDIAWRLTHSKDGNTVYPITPTGYASSSPTFNTITAGHNETYHLDLDIDAIENIYMGAKSLSATTGTLRVACEVHD